ncbi:MAG: gamma-glutamyltransferase [Gammaproteobacteria bacterium]|nr:gamma-glutamyltransferase [Gammaproteobacteria bacterium]
MRWLRFCCLLICTAGLPVYAASTPGKNAIASAHPLATQAGMDILAAGGNAFDAAVAVTAALAVVEPYSSGVGGGGFWLLHRASDGFQTMVDGRETAPAAAQRDMYLDKDGNVIADASMNGPLAAGIPGVPAAMVHLAQNYGKLPLAKTLAPAIQLAQQGFEVDAHYVRMAGFRLKAIQASPEAARLFLKDNAVPAEGYIIKQPELAATLQTLADKGFDGFYKGEVAQKLVDGVRANGGIWQLKDLADYRVKERAPLRIQYRDMTITTAPPPSSGGVALATMLNILEGYELGSADGVTRKHLLVEAMRRAYRDRAIYLGDPDFVQVPVARLTDKNYAAGLRASIRADKATASSSLPGIDSAPGGFHTTHFSILDQAGNRVSATVTVNYPFGSGFVPPGTGVLLNDEMDDFSAKPGTPNAYGLVGAEANAIEPGKRPLSSMSPTFIDTADSVAVLGTPGGSRIITMVLLGILDFADGHDPQSWVSQGRYHHQYLPDEISYEEGALTEAEITSLRSLGHEVKQNPWRYGNMHGILWRKATGSVEAASDPRGVGQARVK